MFVSQTHLPQLLDEAHYTDPALHEREVERLFLPVWHCLAVWDQFPRDGDFLTTELFGRPLILWRTQDRVRAFLNVCAHRFSTLTNKPRGRFDGRMKCQYHGWEYDQTGNTCKIPDAQCFRPLKKGELGLKEYRAEMLGQLVFITFNDDAPSLREFLGPELVDLCLHWFSFEHRITRIADMPLACNWKIVVENVLEAYHLECVHPKTFRSYPAPEDCSHEFHPTFDHYMHDYRNLPASCGPERLVCRLTGQSPEYKWHHLLRYPNTVLGGAGPWHYIQMVWPLTATTCRWMTITMHYSGRRGGWWPFLMHRLLKRLGALAAKQVQREDAAIYPSVHRGTAAPDRPHGGGLISAREERIFAFQEYVLRGNGERVPIRHRPVPEAELANGDGAEVILSAPLSTTG
jgi:choline monooxygenase